MKSISCVIAVLITLSGCALNGEQQTLIGGKYYTTDKNGVIEMTEADLKKGIEEDGMVYLDEAGKRPYIQLSEEEFKAVSADHSALYTMLGLANNQLDDELITLVKVGSLRDNLSRILQEQKWSTLDYDGPDYQIEEPYILKAKDTIALVENLTRGYPVYFCIDDDAKIITLIELNTEAFK